MSDEEKKTIEEQYKEGLVNLSNVIELLINQFKMDYSLDIQQCRLIINYLLMERDFDENYYEELEEEVQELKEKNKDMSCDLTEMRADNIDESTMLKQIKNKLDEKNIPIETLLAEFERLEDIEDKKVQIEYNNVFNKGVKSVEDKIKAKIEFIKGLNEKLYYEENVIELLESILEKE